VPASAPGLSLPPTPISLCRLPTQLHTTLDQPAADLRLFFPSLFYPLRSPTFSRPANDHCNQPPNSPQPLHNGPAQLIPPARAVLCPHAGPLIQDQRASNLEQPSSRPTPTVSDDSSSYHKTPILCCNAGLIREELKASATFPPARKVLTCASTPPTTHPPCVRFWAKRLGSVITGLRSCESGILQVHCCAHLGQLHDFPFSTRRLVLSAFTLHGAVSRDLAVNLRNDTNEQHQTCLRPQTCRASSPLLTSKQ